MAKKEVTIMYDLSDFKDFKRQCERVRTSVANASVTPVREYDLKGKFIRMWPNVKYLSNLIGLRYSTLRTHLKKGNPPTLNDKIYLTGENNIKDRLVQIQMEADKKAIVEYAKKSHQIHVYTSDGSFVGIYTSPKEASKYTKINRSNIYNCIVGKAFVTGGYIFLTPFESIEDRLEKIKNRKTWKTNY